ncbi:hypothetical protein K493DRAFT_30041 [Basidiobolus meristosporus CBS 931.73]|uniref:Uncharacterized protein n=1 Tax=Basidiobolus meristosporus CBS 931.73 TaxID=1314790 RepID=A0A1Y1Y9A0_9FUNG|nr:hypothetical protein K493DRAFT_30041 [Basidiobolus meristosporus CBS 931.73]|eukprot:ORX94567.1 hypothetical protein K493DRAFT_30041 [Basidiobolus meristosporus CBS 931.73]
MDPADWPPLPRSLRPLAVQCNIIFLHVSRTLAMTCFLLISSHQVLVISCLQIVGQCTLPTGIPLPLSEGIFVPPN